MMKFTAPSLRKQQGQLYLLPCTTALGDGRCWLNADRACQNPAYCLSPKASPRQAEYHRVTALRRCDPSQVVRPALRSLIKSHTTRKRFGKWLRGPDSNRRPPGYEPSELPTAPPRHHSESKRAHSDRDLRARFCANSRQSGYALGCHPDPKSGDLTQSVYPPMDKRATLYRLHCIGINFQRRFPPKYTH